MTECAHKLAAKPLLIYAAFTCVGGGCGWFLMNALFNLLANDHDVQKGGAMYGTFAKISGSVGLTIAGLFFVYTACFPRLGFKGSQLFTSILITSSLLVFVVLVASWDYKAPQYPIVVMAAIVGSMIPNLTYFILFPLVASHYAGWLVAPVRMGTDISSLITTFAAETQNPSGSHNRFATPVLFSIYAFLSTIALLAWVTIMRHGIGLRNENVDRCEPHKSGNANLEASKLEKVVTEDTPLITDVRVARPACKSHVVYCKMKECMKHLVENLACPCSLMPLVILATLTQVSEWGLVNMVAKFGAAMTDPVACDGPKGAWVYRTGYTFSCVGGPFGSMASTVAPCPRWLFVPLSLVQLSSAAAVLLATAGIGRHFWQTVTGQNIYILCLTSCALLEGYLLTTAYRFIGDNSDLTSGLKHSASSLLGLLGVVSVNICSVSVGTLISGGVLDCVNP